jgi:LCP family protein required for cell wall assembly
MRLTMMRALLSICLYLGLSVSASAAQDGGETPPNPVLIIDEGEYDILNFLLLGSDTSNPNNAGRTDALMVVSVNQTASTVSLLSIPRDLYVYIPDIGMNKINTAYAFGENNGVDGGGAALLRDTIRYNLGLEIDHYARIDFANFRRIIDDLGGIEIAVDCAIQDWRLIEPDLDPTIEENWEMFTLPVGLHLMDGDLALWYSRSRRTSSDFDRGRRQQAVMRAIWQRIRSLSLFDQLTDVWSQVLEAVATDIQLDEMIGLVPLAGTIDTSRIAAYTFRPNVEVTFATRSGASVLLPIPAAVAALVGQTFQPPTQSELVRENARVEIVNASGVRGFGRVAAERLALEGFVPYLSNEAVPYREYTVIYDYTGRSKGSSLGALQAALRVTDNGVLIEPNSGREVDFRVEIGGSYFSCTHNVIQPTLEPESTASAGS